MGSSIEKSLCNGIPIDHRLKQYLPKAKQRHAEATGKHANIIQSFSETVLRDGRPISNAEADFATWLAKPDMTGGLVVALLQPPQTQIYTSDFQRVKDECATLAYLEESLIFMNGSGSIATTSVFDAFPFITRQIPYESVGGLSIEALNAYNTFVTMLEAKKPEVVFACWRVKVDDSNLRFSGKGIGQTNHVENLTLSNGHVVRVVNGFHPSSAANFRPNESCFRKLFALELCKAFCELNTCWREEPWMSDLRRQCRDRNRKLMQGKFSCSPR